MRSRYRFEIVRRAFGRFGWILIERDRRGRHVVARSERSWRSKKRVRRAIKALGGVGIFDATDGEAGFSLPATSFQLDRGVVPLIVRENPLGSRRPSLGGRRARRR